MNCVNKKGIHVHVPKLVDGYVDEFTIRSILYLEILKTKICTNKPRDLKNLALHC
jgi:hypothetical protein